MVVPVATPVTLPFLSTLAIDSSADVYVTLALSIFTLILRLVVLFTYTVVESGAEVNS